MFLVRNLESGGVQRTLMRLAAALAGRGHAVYLVACAPRLIGTGTVPAKVRVTHRKRSLVPTSRSSRSEAEQGALQRQERRQGQQ